MEPIKLVDKCFIPALFVHGSEDSFISPHHSQDLHDKYAGDKNIILVEGDHNSHRPEFCNDSITIFITNLLNVGENAQEELSQDFPLSSPSHSFPSQYQQYDEFEAFPIQDERVQQLPSPPSPRLVQQIKEMGFSDEQAIVALQRNDNNVERAIEFLLTN